VEERREKDATVSSRLIYRLSWSYEQARLRYACTRLPHRSPRRSSDRFGDLLRPSGLRWATSSFGLPYR